MKLATVRFDGVARVGVVDDDQIRLVEPLSTLVEILEQGSPAEVIAGGELGQPVALSDVELLPPIFPARRNIFCVGLNYRDHFDENPERAASSTGPSVPSFFSKATTTLARPFADVPDHSDVTVQFDAEVELAVIVGRRVRDVALEDAMEAIAGYTIANDLSARDLQQEPHGQWFRGKSLDGSCPMGPWMVTADEIGDPSDLTVRALLNDDVVQEARISQMIFPIPFLLSRLSQGLTLLPGDILLTGTPAGVGLYREPQRFLRAGDVVTCEVDRIGAIRNRIAHLPSYEPDVEPSGVGVANA